MRSLQLSDLDYSHAPAFPKYRCIREAAVTAQLALYGGGDVQDSTVFESCTIAVLQPGEVIQATELAVEPTTGKQRVRIDTQVDDDDATAGSGGFSLSCFLSISLSPSRPTPPPQCLCLL